jgi:hypothetical protein
MATANPNFFPVRYQRHAAFIRIPDAPLLGNQLCKKIENLPANR